MNELTEKEVKQVYGGLLGAFVAGLAIGAVAKKLYNKYKANQEAKAAAQAALAESCANSSNCI